MALVVAVVIAAGVAVGIVVEHHGNKDTQAAVRQAYLGWWSAREEAYLSLNPAPLKPLMTSSGYQKEAAQVEQQAVTGDPFRLTADHNLQIAVYKDSPYASVDDVWADHSVALDPTTHQPLQPDPNIDVEDSTFLKLIAGRWMVASVSRFGVSRPTPGQVVSYAAASNGGAPPEPTLSEVDRVFRQFISDARSAFKTGKVGGAARVTSGSELQHISEAIAYDQSKNERLDSSGQDNVRIGLQDNTTAWVYDSYYDSSWYVGVKNSKRIGKPVIATGTTAYELVKGATGWTVNYSVGP